MQLLFLFLFFSAVAALPPCIFSYGRSVCLKNCGCLWCDKNQLCYDPSSNVDCNTITKTCPSEIVNQEVIVLVCGIVFILSIMACFTTISCYLCWKARKRESEPEREA
jgi:hypothetical protein